MYSHYFQPSPRSAEDRLEREERIYWPGELPDQLWCDFKAPIGPKMEWEREQRVGEEEAEEEEVEGQTRIERQEKLGRGF